MSWARWFGLAAVLAVLAACGHGAIVHRPGETFASAVQLEGNHAISDDDLESGLALRRAVDEGRAIDPYELSTDADRIVGQYTRRGFFDTTVATKVVRDGLAETAVFTIVEGPRAPLVRVDVVGLPADSPVSAAHLRSTIVTLDGEPFDYDAYDDAKPLIQAALEDAGYARAHLEARVLADRVHHEAVIQLAIETGPLCRFGAVEIRGLSGPLADAARARFAITAGEPFSNKAIASTQRAMYDMNRFSTALVQADLTRDDAVVPVTVTLALAKPIEIRAGGSAGVDQLNCLIQPHGSYAITGWPYVLTTTSFSLTPGFAVPRADYCSPSFSSWTAFADELRVQALAQLTRIDLFHPRVTGQIGVGFQYLAVEAYTSTGPRATAGLSSPLGIPQLTGHVGYSWRYLWFVNINPIVDTATREGLRIDTDERVSAFDQSIVADFRDNPFEPTRGAYAALRAIEGVKLGGAYQFFELQPDLRAYLTLWRLTFAAHLHVGAILGDIPPTERYFSGGASSMRGFAERQLSPVATSFVNGVEESVVVGGGGLIETGLEVRATVGHKFGGAFVPALFLDGGDVTNTPGELDPSNLYWAAGGGFRFVTNYGSFRLDVARRINRDTTDADLDHGRYWAWQIGFGEAY